MEIQWERPPEAVVLRARSGQGAKYVDFAIALREHPGEWAVLPADLPSAKSAGLLCQNIRRGVQKAFAPKGSFEAVYEDTKVWVRCLPEDQRPPAPAPAQPAADVDDGDKSPEPPREEAQQPAPAAAAGDAIAPKIRAWAREHGYEVPERGRLPRDITDAFFVANPEIKPPEHLRVV